MRRHPLLPIAGLAALATMAASCLSPTLPLPPPDLPEAISPPTSNGLWQVVGNCIPGAFVTVFNPNTSPPTGTVVEDVARAGTYNVAIAGTECQLVWVEQQTEDGTSAQTFFVLQAFANGEPVNPQACP